MNKFNSLWYKDLNDGITLIDMELNEPNFAGSYLIQEKGKAAFIEAGTGKGTPLLLEVLRKKNIRLEDVEYVMLTHIHLDHAGGAGNLMKHLPNARLVVHPRGARHIADPSKLISGAAVVYGGEDKLFEIFGSIVATPKEKIIEAPDNFTIVFQGRKFTFLDTPGHALHHLCIWDEASKGMFTGDTFGISYGEFKTENGTFIFPSTSPVQADPPVAHKSVDRILSFTPRYVYLTHFGRYDDVAQTGKELHDWLDKYIALAKESLKEKDKSAFIKSRLQELFWNTVQKSSLVSKDYFLSFLETDIRLNADGLAIWVEKAGK